MILLPFNFIIAQSDSLKSVEHILSNFINSATIEKESSDLYDLIEYYLENPFDLNKFFYTVFILFTKSEILFIIIISDFLFFISFFGQ